jgi:hypothetical protein
MENLTPVRPASIIGNSRLKEIKTIRGVANNLLLQKKQNLNLEKKFFRIQKDKILKDKLREKERLQESKKPTKKTGIIREELKRQSVKLYDLFKFFVGFKVLQWMSRRENIESIGEIAKAMKNIFKIIDYLAGIGVEGVLGGLHSVLFGSNFIEKFFGIFKLIGGFFIIRRFLFPGQILKDINWILKNRKSIGKVFKALGSGKLKEALGRIFKLLTPTLYTAYNKGLTAAVKRVILKVFGKNTLKLLTKVASKIGFNSAKEFVKNSAKSIAKPLTKIPFIGPILGFGLNLIFGDPLDKAAVKAIGAGIGAWLGGIVMGALGSIVPVAGTAAGAGLGAFVGGFIGDWVGDKLYGFFKGFTAPKEPALAVGGIVTKPTRALIGEAGPEAVIPLPKIYDGTILNAPMGIVASSMIGGIDAVISSLGAAGLTIRPYASSLLAPYRREFGASNYVFTSEIGRTRTDVTAKATTQTNDQEEVAKILGLNKTINLIKKKEASEEAKKSRYNSGNSIREILGDILNNIINLNFTEVSKKTKHTDDEDPAKPKFTGPIPQGKSADFWTLAAVVSREDGDPQGQADVAQSIYNRLASGAYGGKTIKDLIISTWQYEPTWKYPKGPTRGNGTPNEEWLNITDIKSAAAATGTSEGHVAAAARAILDAGLQKKSAEFVQGRTDFTGYSKTSRKSQIQRKSGDNYFGWDFNYRNNLVASVPTFTGVKMQTGGLVQTPGVPDTGPGYTIQGTSDAYGRPVVFSQPAASAFAKMMKDSGGIVKGSDIASSKRSPKKNSDVGGATRSKHLYGIGMDIHGSSQAWIKKNGAKYGWTWAPYGGPRDHGGHFTFGGKGIQPSDVALNSEEKPTNETSSSPEFTAEMGANVAKELGKLFQMLTGTPKTNGSQLEKDSMDYVQSFKDFKPNPDTYIMMGGTNIISSTNILTPIEQPDYSSGSFSSIDSAAAFKLKTRL